jgi:hypothetical protein
MLALQTAAVGKANDSLPDELWIEIMARLDAENICLMQMACKQFKRLHVDALKLFCGSRWPCWYAIAQSKLTHTTVKPSLYWKQVVNAFQLREREQSVLLDVEKACQLQKTVLPAHRALLAEWLLEVGCADATPIKRGNARLDRF